MPKQSAASTLSVSQRQMLPFLPQVFLDGYARGMALACILLACAAALSCSSPTTAVVTNNEVPATVSLSPAGRVGLELGQEQSFLPNAQNSAGTNLTENYTFQTSAPGIVTVASNGTACAGTWNSLTTPTVCTPGSTGIAQITATANGVTSPPVTIYVHQHVTNVVIQKVPNQPPTLSSACFSKGAPSGPERVLYQAFAYAGTADITASVGPFHWGSLTSPGQVSSPAVLLTPAGVTAPLNQEIATANIPGATSIFASAGGTTSQPVTFVTCPVQSISFTINGSAPQTAPYVIGPALTVNANITDTANMTLTGVPLTWSSSNPAAVSVAGSGVVGVGSVGSIGAAGSGSASVTASCTPPACNGGISPSLPIYPTQVVSVIAKPTSSTTTTPAVFVTTTACAATTQSCTPRIVPITRSGNTAPFATQVPINLPSSPNSLVFGRTSSSSAYIGVQNQAFGTQGLMRLSGSSIAQFNGAAGRVLAVSPDSTTAILADTTDSPSRVIICKSCNTTGPTMVSILFPNPVAAAFSPEGSVGGLSGFKAYVVSPSSCPGTSSAGCLLVYSTVDAPKIVPLGAPATDAAFIGDGAVGFIAGGDPAGMTYLPTCDVPPSTSGSLATVPAPAQLLRTLPDGYSVLALAPPNLQIITAALGGTGCPSPRGSFTITNSIGPALNIGEGTFTPTQFFLSPDATTAYILGQTSGGGVLPFIITFNLTTDTTSLISLSNNATPLNAAVSPAGDFLFVGGSDGQVHIVDTSTGFDVQQIAFTFPQSSLCIGPGNPATQVSLSSLTITGASQNGVSTTFTYSLTTGAPLSIGEAVTISAMNDAGNNGTFTITALGTGTFTVTNSSGVSATGQNGSGIVPLTCNPDLVAARP